MNNLNYYLIENESQEQLGNFFLSLSPATQHVTTESPMQKREISKIPVSVTIEEKKTQQSTIDYLKAF